MWDFEATPQTVGKYILSLLNITAVVCPGHTFSSRSLEHCSKGDVIINTIIKQVINIHYILEDLLLL